MVSKKYVGMTTNEFKIVLASDFIGGRLESGKYPRGYNCMGKVLFLKLYSEKSEH